MAPFWRHNASMGSTSQKLSSLGRQSLRLTNETWKEIDAAREKRAGCVSRNTWITEAVLEKLARERGTAENVSDRSAEHG